MTSFFNLNSVWKIDLYLVHCILLFFWGFNLHLLKPWLTFNNNVYGAELLSFRRFTMVNSSILHDRVSDYHSLNMVKWIEQLQSITIICWIVFSIQTCLCASFRLFEPDCIGHDLAARWEMTREVNSWAFGSLNGIGNWCCREIYANELNSFWVQPFCLLLHISILKSNQNQIAPLCKQNKLPMYDKETCVSHLQRRLCMCLWSQHCSPSPNTDTRRRWQQLQGI